MINLIKEILLLSIGIILTFLGMFVFINTFPLNLIPTIIGGLIIGRFINKVTN